MIDPKKTADKVFAQYEEMSKVPLTFDGEHLRRLTQCIVEQVCAAANKELDQTYQLIEDTLNLASDRRKIRDTLFSAVAERVEDMEIKMKIKDNIWGEDNKSGDNDK
jgi:hypothetical protein